MVACSLIEVSGVYEKTNCPSGSNIFLPEKSKKNFVKESGLYKLSRSPSPVVYPEKPICAETTSYKDYLKYAGSKGAKENGKTRQEGKEYLVKDGDVIRFLFNV